MALTAEMPTLKLLRRASKLAQPEIARRLGVSRSTWQRWEHGVVPMPTGRITSVARIFGLAPTVVLYAVNESVARATGLPSE